MKTVGVLAAIALALALQTTLARFLAGGTGAVDFVLVAVVCVALTRGPVGGLLAGSIAGLIQDSLSTTSGVIGIGGLAKSIVGFLAGAVGQQFIVATALPRVVMFVASTAVHAGLFMGMYTGLGLQEFPAPLASIASQSLGNTVVGLVVFAIIESVPGALDRRRTGRRAGK